MKTRKLQGKRLRSDRLPPIDGELLVFQLDTSKIDLKTTLSTGNTAGFIGRGSNWEPG
jgi:hypothetical protein